MKPTWTELGPMPIWYLATPYMGFSCPALGDQAKRLDLAFALACEQAAILMLAGVQVYSLIVHGHAVASAPGGRAIGEKAWLAHGQEILAYCRGMIECRLPGWETSAGMRQERNQVVASGRPVIPMEPGRVPDLILEIEELKPTRA